MTIRGDHAASTCRMAKTSETGVVDKDLAVFDVDNLHVCSNAVFPSGAAVNPTLTLTALSLRLGKRLSGDR
jgi:choline dehydrogenase-like flavoprotein